MAVALHLHERARSMKPHLLVCLLLVGCVDAVDEATAEVELAARCKPFACGSTSNSPEIDDHGLHDLIVGRANATGFTLLWFEKYGTKYDKVWVKEAKLFAATQAGASPPGGVVGGALRVVHNSGLVYLIRIRERSDAAYWAQRPNVVPATRTATHLIEWLEIPANHPIGGTIPPTAAWKNVCTNPTTAPGETLGMTWTHVVLFERDVIDADTIRVTGQDAARFNIGCAGHALAKLHLSGHTQAAFAQGFETTLAQRTTFLKMITADYCGTGDPFTVAGQPLDWADARSWMTFVSDRPLLEARWTEKGASCLNIPRVLAHPTVESRAAFPDFDAALAEKCPRPPRCAGGAEDFAKHHLVSANPL